MPKSNSYVYPELPSDHEKEEKNSECNFDQRSRVSFQKPEYINRQRRKSSNISISQSITTIVSDKDKENPSSYQLNEKEIPEGTEKYLNAIKLKLNEIIKSKKLPKENLDNFLNLLIVNSHFLPTS